MQMTKAWQLVLATIKKEKHSIPASEVAIKSGLSVPCVRVAAATLSEQGYLEFHQVLKSGNLVRKYTFVHDNGVVDKIKPGAMHLTTEDSFVCSEWTRRAWK